MTHVRPFDVVVNRLNDMKARKKGEPALPTAVELRLFGPVSFQGDDEDILARPGACLWRLSTTASQRASLTDQNAIVFKAECVQGSLWPCMTHVRLSCNGLCTEDGEHARTDADVCSCKIYVRRCMRPRS
jgi:hypothetical protein